MCRGRRRSAHGYHVVAGNAPADDPAAPLSHAVSEGHREPVPVVIVHRNNSRACATTIADFRAQSVETEIVVVDNASGPAHRGALQAIEPPIDVIELDANRGFGPAANVGLERWLCADTGDWVIVAPHDVRLDPSALDQLFDAVEDQGPVGLVCGDVGDQARPAIDLFLGAIPRPALSHDGFEPADYPHGTLMALARECVSEVGGFDDRYFAYGEEAELGLRARSHGWLVGVVRGAMVANPGTAPHGAVVDYLKQRNTLLLLAEHAGRWPVVFRSMVVIGQIGWGSLRPSTRAPWFHRRARWLALRDHLRGRTGPPPEELW